MVVKIYRQLSMIVYVHTQAPFIVAYVLVQYLGNFPWYFEHTHSFYGSLPIQTAVHGSFHVQAAVHVSVHIQAAVHGGVNTQAAVHDSLHIQAAFHGGRLHINRGSCSC